MLWWHAWCNRLLEGLFTIVAGKTDDIRPEKELVNFRLHSVEKPIDHLSTLGTCHIGHVKIHDNKGVSEGALPFEGSTHIGKRSHPTIRKVNMLFDVNQIRTLDFLDVLFKLRVIDEQNFVYFLAQEDGFLGAF